MRLPQNRRAVTRLPGVKLVVFDLDGTLIDSARDLAAAVNAMLGRLAPGSEPLSDEAVRSFVGDGARKLVARSLAGREIQIPLETALPVFLEAYRHCMLERTHLYPGVREALDALRGSRTLAVLSNKPGEMCRAILAGLGVADRFARIYGGDDVPKKPDPAGLLLLVRELDASPEQTLMVGDSANDMRTGRAAGVRTVGVSYGFDRSGTEAEKPDALLANLAELPNLLA
jgi:phosphoglycolate phosphatase